MGTIFIGMSKGYSFGEALLYFIWGLLATFIGDVGPFNFFLSIYGIDTKDFKTIKPGPLGSNFENKTIKCP